MVLGIVGEAYLIRIGSINQDAAKRPMCF